MCIRKCFLSFLCLCDVSKYLYSNAKWSQSWKIRCVYEWFSFVYTWISVICLSVVTWPLIRYLYLVFQMYQIFMTVFKCSDEADVLPSFKNMKKIMTGFKVNELSWVYWCFASHATIFQSYMWRHRCAGGLKKLLYLRSGSQRHRHFAGFFNVPVYTDTVLTFLYDDSDTPPL